MNEKYQLVKPSEAEDEEYLNATYKNASNREAFEKGYSLAGILYGLELLSAGAGLTLGGVNSGGKNSGGAPMLQTPDGVVVNLDGSVVMGIEGVLLPPDISFSEKKGEGDVEAGQNKNPT